MEKIKELSKELVKIVNQSDNNYDAVQDCAKIITESLADTNIIKGQQEQQERIKIIEDCIKGLSAAGQKERAAKLKQILSQI